MLPVITSWTHKPPNIEVFKFDSASLEDIAVWLSDNLPLDGYSVTPFGNALRFGADGEPPHYAYNGCYIAKDSDGNIFVLDEPILKAFYNPVANG